MSRPRISDAQYKLRGRKKKRKPAPGEEPNPDYLMAVASLKTLMDAKDAEPKGSAERIRIMRAIRKAKENICKLALNDDTAALPKLPAKAPKDAYERWEQESAALEKWRYDPAKRGWFNEAGERAPEGEFVNPHDYDFVGKKKN